QAEHERPCDADMWPGQRTPSSCSYGMPFAEHMRHTGYREGSRVLGWIRRRGEADGDPAARPARLVEPEAVEHPVVGPGRRGGPPERGRQDVPPVPALEGGDDHHRDGVLAAAAPQPAHPDPPAAGGWGG